MVGLSMTFDPYAVLGLSRDASTEDIVAAFRRRARESHPDRGGSSEDFQSVKRSYHILSDPEHRLRYDQTGDCGDGRPAETPTMVILSQAFKAVVEAMAVSMFTPKADVLEHMVHYLQEKTNEMEARRGVIRKSIGIMRQCEGSFSTVDKDNLMQAIVERHLAASTAALGTLTKKLDCYHEAMRTLTGFHFQRNGNVEPPWVRQLMGKK
jgi:hypothetical protein